MNIKNTNNKIKFPENQVWLHKDGKQELLAEMPNEKLLNIIFPEANKRYQQKHYGALKMAKILDAITSILATRGYQIKLESLPNEVFHNRKQTLSNFSTNELILECRRRINEKEFEEYVLNYKKEKQIN